MTKYKLEYIWLDGYTPVPNLRGKTQIKEYSAFPELEVPLWGFDGSSTMQAEGRSSDCVLKPVRHFLRPGPHQRCARDVRSHDAGWQDPARNEQACDGLDDEGAWFGFEQEYFMYKDDRRWVSLLVVIQHRKVRTTLALATRMSAMLLARSLRSISICASLLASITKASMPKWLRVSGNSRSSEGFEGCRRNVDGALSA